MTIGDSALLQCAADGSRLQGVAKAAPPISRQDLQHTDAAFLVDANEARQHAIQKCARHCARGKAFRYIIPARRHVIVFKHKVCMAFIQNAQFHARHGRGRHRPQIPCLTALLSACTACFLPKKAGTQRTVGHIKPGAGQMFQRRARLPLCFGAKHRRAADTLMHGQRVLCAV